MDRDPVALDAMGGDAGCAPTIEGAVAAAREDGARVLVVGDQAQLQAHIERLGAADLLAREALALVHAPDVVTMDDKPGHAVRKKKQSSMRVACDLVQQGRACGALSAGNSGAMMATALLVFGRVDGVLRPAIGTVLPSFSPFGLTLLVDAGANVDCEPVYLAQFGILGSVYVENVYGVRRPLVGVVSNGEEDAKGTRLTREALELLKRTDVNLHGYVEGRDLNKGIVPVIVTDGFTGNVMLKTAEGVFTFMSATIKAAFEQGSVVDKLAGLMARPVFERIKRKLDPREFGAAPLLGLRRPAFIAHGGSDAYAVRMGIRAVRRYVEHDVVGAMTAAIARNAHIGAHAADDDDGDDE